MRVANKQKIVAISILIVMVSTLIVGTLSQVASGAPVAATSMLDTEFIQLSVGTDFVCAVQNDGNVKCWGENGSGQLGRDSTTNVGAAVGEMASLTPINLGSGRTARMVAIGVAHACALLDNNTVKCWGDNTNGQLGQGNTIAFGDGSGNAMSSLAAIDLGTTTAVSNIAVGNNFSCALFADGKVKCWGKNNVGQLGLSVADDRGDGASEMGTSLPFIDLGINKTATAITAADSSACAILNDGTVKCWGSNTNGELGQGNTDAIGAATGTTVAAANPVNLGAGKTAAAIAAGANHVCALLNDATVKCWGDNFVGQLGQGSTTDVGTTTGQMAALTAIDLGTGLTAKSIDAGGETSCALLSNNTLKCWGENGDGQLGLGDTANRGDAAGEMADALPAVNVGASKTVVAVSVGASNSCALLNDVTVKCWGANASGQLGQGNSTKLGITAGDIAAAPAIIVDITAPSVTTTAPTAAVASTNPSPRYTGLCESRIPVVVQVFAGSTSTGTPLHTFTGACVNGAYSITSTTALENATYTFTVSQTDAAGNVGRTLPVTYVLAANPWSTPPAADSNRRLAGNYTTSFLPGNVYVTKDFGFTMTTTRALKPQVRMREYVGIVRLTLTANFVRRGKVQTYRCTYRAFGSSAKKSRIGWRWTRSPRACTLPVLLRNQLLRGETTLRARGTVTRYWKATGLKTRPDGSVINLRRINVVLKHG